MYGRKDELQMTNYNQSWFHKMFYTADFVYSKSCSDFVIIDFLLYQLSGFVLYVGEEAQIDFLPAKLLKINPRIFFKNKIPLFSNFNQEKLSKVRPSLHQRSKKSLLQYQKL